jgi:DNA-binding IclR family transcriptional regulator
VERAIRLVQAISEGETVANLQRAARAVGINRTTLMRLLHTLEAARFIELFPNGSGYRIGLDLVGLVARASAYSQDLMQSADMSRHMALHQIRRRFRLQSRMER